MIAAWIVYGLCVSSLLCLAALMADRSARWNGWPARWVWAGAIVLSGVLPWLALTSGRLFEPAAAGGSASTRAMGTLAEPDVLGSWSLLGGRLADSVGAAWSGIASTASAIDLPLLVVWGAGSAILLAVLAASYRRLGRAASGWPLQHVHGYRVRVSDDIGPAVLGIRRAQVVLPRWAVESPHDHRRLIVLHEVEHLRAGDGRLLVAATVFVALMPWNLLAWWQLRRLRLAVELDCDRRVLRAGVQVRQYASLLLEAGSRRGASPLMAAAFVHFHSQLGRRIREMTEKRKGPRYLPAALGTVGAVALLAAACETPAPTDPLALQEATEGKRLSHISPADAGELHRIIEEEAGVGLVIEEADGDTYFVDKVKLAEIREEGLATALIEKLTLHGEPGAYKLTLVHEDGRESGSFGLRSELTDPAGNVDLEFAPEGAKYHFRSEDPSTLSPRTDAEAEDLKRRQAAEREAKRKMEGGAR